jgi:uncharacterized BrkB/YihY/UPF0761 family membrane protein
MATFETLGTVGGVGETPFQSCSQEEDLWCLDAVLVSVALFAVCGAPLPNRLTVARRGAVAGAVWTVAVCNRLFCARFFYTEMYSNYIHRYGRF